jgi:hypothetical protein
VAPASKGDPSDTEAIGRGEEMNFPTTGYVVTVTHFDTYIDVRTQVATEKNRYRAAILIGHTNYQVRIGDLLSWNDDREVFWYPAEEEIPETWKITPRKLWLVRILSRETYSV